MGMRLATRQHNQGFTLVELMVALAILAIMSAVAVPRFSDMIARNRMSGATNEIVAAIHLARSEAVTKNARVVICATRAGTACDGNDWSRVMTFVDADRNGSRSNNEEIRQVVDVSNPNLRVFNNGGANIVFSPSGLSPMGLATSANNTLTVCSPELDGRQRIITVGVSTSSISSAAGEGACE